LAQTRGIKFQITPEVETELRQAGATDELLATLRKLAPKTAILLIESSPGGAHVYVDDEPVGTTSAEGRLKLTTLGPGQHRVRLSLDGYKDDSRDVALAAGAALEIKETLEPAKSTAPTGSNSKAAEPSSSHNASTAATEGSQPVVYVFRKHKTGSGAVHLEIYSDEVSLGQLPDGTYLAVKSSPGRHRFSSTSKQSQTELDLVNGSTYYIELSIPGGGWVGFGIAGYKKGGGTMRVVSSEIGQSEIKELKPR
jgi:hypothetical protein